MKKKYIDYFYLFFTFSNTAPAIKIIIFIKDQLYEERSRFLNLFYKSKIIKYDF
jgi:hypothetical protein